MAALLLASTGCRTVTIQTKPAQASVAVDGEDISETGEFAEKPGFSDHNVSVQAPGHKSKTVQVERTEMSPVLKWLSLAGSLGCGALGGGAGCCLGCFLGNRACFPALVGAAVTSPSPLDGILQWSSMMIVANLAPDIATVPCMAACSLLGGFPLLGLLIPVIFRVSPKTVDVELERGEDPPPPRTRRRKHKKAEAAQEQDAAAPEEDVEDKPKPRVQDTPAKPAEADDDR